MKESEVKELLWFPALLFVSRSRSDKLTLLPLLFVLSTVLTFPLTVAYVWLYGISEEAAIFKESEYGAFGSLANLIVIATIILVVNLAMLYLIKKGRLNVLRAFFSVLITYVFASLFALFAYSFGLLLGIEHFAIYYSALAFGFLVGITSFSSDRLLWLRNSMLLLLGIMIGTLLGTSLGRLTPIILMAGFIVFDAYLVYRGPLGKVLSSLPLTNKGSEESGRVLLIGLGDFAFLSLPIAYTLAYYGILPGVATATSIVVGVLLESIVLKRRGGGAIPGLPLPLSLALAVILFLLIAH